MKKTINQVISRKLSKYISLGSGKQKVLRPREIVKLYDKYDVYGDVRILKLINEGKFSIKEETLLEVKQRDLTLLLLRQKGKYFFHQIERVWFGDSRKHRLASAIAYAGLSKDNEDEVSFMKSELGLPSYVSYEALKAMFLESTKVELMIKDILRLIQILEQQSKR